MKHLIYLLSLVLFFSSCGDTESFAANSGATGTIASPSTTFPLLLDATDGSVDGTGDKLTVRLTPAGGIRIGEAGEGGALSLTEFLAQTEVSESSPRAAELEYVVNGKSRFLPLNIESLESEGGGGLLVTASGRAMVDEDPSQVKAQQVSGSITGTVKTDDGSSLPGATLDLRANAGPYERISVSDAIGNYRFFNVPAQFYSLTAGLSGFRSQTFNDVRVSVGRTTRVDFVLFLESVVEFSGGATLRLLPESGR